MIVLGMQAQNELHVVQEMAARKNPQSPQPCQVPSWWIAVRVAVILLIMFGVVWLARNSIDLNGTQF